jgi:ribose transport system ATP-binding protein
VRRDSGEILLSGRKLTIRRPKDAIKAGICLITEDRKKYALFGERSVTENVMIISNELFGGYILKLREENSSTDTKIGELKIAVSSRSQTVRSLSGGNQQKTVIARWLLSRAEVFIFDEPTKGIDIGAKEDVYKLILELARGGKSVIMISSDMPELISMSDRIGVMRNGRLIQVLEGGNVKEEDLIHHFIGM